MKATKLNISHIKKAAQQVVAVKGCPQCNGYLELIKEHQKLNHKDDLKP